MGAGTGLSIAAHQHGFAWLLVQVTVSPRHVPCPQVHVSQRDPSTFRPVSRRAVLLPLPRCKPLSPAGSRGAVEPPAASLLGASPGSCRNPLPAPAPAWLARRRPHTTSKPSQICQDGGWQGWGSLPLPEPLAPRCQRAKDGFPGARGGAVGDRGRSRRWPRTAAPAAPRQGAGCGGSPSSLGWARAVPADPAEPLLVLGWPVSGRAGAGDAGVRQPRSASSSEGSSVLYRLSCSLRLYLHTIIYQRKAPQPQRRFSTPT